MRHTLVAALLLGLVSPLAFVGCGEPQPADTPPPVTTPEGTPGEMTPPEGGAAPAPAEPAPAPAPAPEETPK
jgi:hypothetical protein